MESLRGFSKISLITADLDGTFVDTRRSRPFQTLEDLRRSLHHYRHQVSLTLATGRVLAGVQPILQGLSLQKDIPLILYNGSVVVRNKSANVIWHRTIPTRATQQVLEIARRYPVRIFAYVFRDPSCGIFRLQEDQEWVLGWSRDEGPSFEFNGLPVEWQRDFIINEAARPSAILIEVPSGSHAATRIENLLANIRGIACTRSGRSYIEIRPSGSDKGVALAAVAKSLGLRRENILALGDNDNDAEMLAWAGIGVAIAGSSPAAIASSDYVCRHGAAEGAVEVLRLVKHARHYFFRPKTPKSPKG